MIDLSAVNNLFGLITLITFKFPCLNSVSLRMIEYLSNLDSLVIWQRIISSPSIFATTNAGLLFDFVKSENGNGKTTTSPFTNLSMPLHPLLNSNPYLILFHLLMLLTFFHLILS